MDTLYWVVDTMVLITLVSVFGTFYIMLRSN